MSGCRGLADKLSAVFVTYEQAGINDFRIQFDHHDLLNIPSQAGGPNYLAASSLVTISTANQLLFAHDSFHSSCSFTPSTFFYLR